MNSSSPWLFAKISFPNISFRMVSREFPLRKLPLHGRNSYKYMSFFNKRLSPTVGNSLPVDSLNLLKFTLVDVLFYFNISGILDSDPYSDLKRKYVEGKEGFLFYMQNELSDILKPVSNLKLDDAFIVFVAVRENVCNILEASNTRKLNIFLYNIDWNIEVAVTHSRLCLSFSTRCTLVTEQQKTGQIP